MHKTIDNVNIDLPEIGEGSLDEAQLFVSAVFAHLVMGGPLTARVSELRSLVRTDAGFRAKVETAIHGFVEEDALNPEGCRRLTAFLELHGEPCV